MKTLFFKTIWLKKHVSRSFLHQITSLMCHFLERCLKKPCKGIHNHETVQHFVMMQQQIKCILLEISCDKKTQQTHSLTLKWNESDRCF